jgi:hypothetical protein
MAYCEDRPQRVEVHLCGGQLRTGAWVKVRLTRPEENHKEETQEQ